MMIKSYVWPDVIEKSKTEAEQVTTTNIFSSENNQINRAQLDLKNTQTNSDSMLTLTTNRQ